MTEGMQSIILLSKLQTPQVKTKTLFRQRLIDLLAENLNKKIVLLCAGAGYGKTTFLSQFISSKDIRYIYYHLEKNDADPVIFFSYLIAGIRKIEPKFGKKTENLTHFFNYQQRYLEIIVGTFINEIIEYVKDDLYIILEDYHTLYPSEHIDNILTYLFNHLPPHLHLIISSRVAPPISMSKLRARDEIFELRTEHLRFTKQEIKNLFGSVYSIFLKESEFEWIEEHSEGWPTSLRLMLQSVDYLVGKKPSRYIRKILASYYQSQSNVFNYFAQEIYNQESKKIKQFLVDCSIFEWLTPELCDAVTKQKNSSDILIDLTSRNAFLFRILDVGYRFHNLFRDFLRSKISGTSREKRLYRRAGDFCSKNNRLEEAAQFYLKAGDHERAASIIENIGFNLMWQGRSGFLCSYIEKIPKLIRNKRPLLLTNYANALVQVGRSEEAKKDYLRAVKMLRMKPRARKQCADALYNLGGIALNQGKLTMARRWFTKALDICPKSASLTRASALNSAGVIYRAVGSRDLHEATGYFQQALKIAQRHGYKDLEASILNNWAMNEFKMGNLNSAHSKLMKTADLLKTYFSPGCGGGFYNAAHISLLLGHRKEARSILDSGIKICGSYNDLWSLARIWEGYALWHQEYGDLDKAKQLIAKALEIYEKLGIVTLIIEGLTAMCRINIKAGELVKAERNLAKTWVLKGNRNDLKAVPLLLTEAQLRLAQEKPNDAEVILISALKLSQHFKRTLDSFLVNVELSKVYHFQQQTKKTIAALERAVMTSRLKGYDYLFMNALQKEKWMLQILRRERIENKYIASVLKKSKLDIHWVDVFLFGLPRVVVDDIRVPDEAWKTVKSKKLLCYLLLHREKKISQDRLIEALWQNASHRSGSDSLRKAIQHIRQIFRTNLAKKGDVIVSGKRLYQISPQLSVRLDTEEFHKLINQAKKAREKNGNYEEYLKRALLLYKEEFATGWYDSWVEEMRRYYQGLYEECLLMMADFCSSENRYGESIAWFKKLIAIDFCNEAYHRKLLQAYSRIGRYKDIIRDFEQLRKILKKELNTDPQRETVDLYESLMSQRSQKIR